MYRVNKMESKPYGYDIRDSSVDKNTIILAEMARLREKGLITKKVNKRKKNK